jgi:hypothetical protein
MVFANFIFLVIDVEEPGNSYTINVGSYLSDERKEEVNARITDIFEKVGFFMLN